MPGLRQNGEFLITDIFERELMEDVVKDAWKDQAWLKNSRAFEIAQALLVGKLVSDALAIELWQKLAVLQNTYLDACDGIKANAVKRMRELIF